MSRIAARFAQLQAEGRAALMPYLMLGYPQANSTVALATALQAAGADLFELGVPFSDPLADGATIQRASERALANGIRVPDCIQAIRMMRQQGVHVPIVPMGYYNPFLQYGFERFCADVAEAGGDGLIIPDLPPEEASEARQACQTHGLDLIMFVAPTSTDERIKQAAELASGFIYCVALTGVTGARSAIWSGLPEFLQRVRQFTNLPLVVGFGISNPDHVRQVTQHAAGAIVASALINTIDQAPAEAMVETAAQFVQHLRTGLA